MKLYSKEQFLESEEFPFAILPYETLPSRPAIPHIHDFFEVVFVAHGHGEHIYQGQAYPIFKGDFFVIPPGVEHDYRVIGDAPLKIYNVMFLPSFIKDDRVPLSEVTPFVSFFYVEPYLREKMNFEAHLKLSLLEADEVQQRLERLAAEYEEKPLGYQLAIKAILLELLVFVSRCYEKRVIKPFFDSNETKAIKELCEYIDKHYAHPLNLQQVCRICGMSQTIFTSKFKQIVGKTFIEYRNEVRIHASLKPLRESDDKIIDIAQQVGIHDLSHFNKLFKQHLQLTPGQYRAKHRS